jgi:hypothetical protein
MSSQRIKKIIIFFAPIVMTLCFILIIGIRYGIVDDIFIDYITEGIWGSGENQFIILPYLSVGFTYLLYLFKSIFTQLNIYLISMYFFLTVSFSALQYLFYKKYHSLLSFVLLLFAQLILLNYFTYTVIAYLVCFVGLIFLFEKNSSYFKCLGCLFLFMGISIRKDVFLSLLIIFIPYIIYNWKRLKSIKIYFAISLIVFGIVNISNILILKNDSITQSYLEWNDLSTQIRDYESIDYEKYASFLERKHISENDLNCLNAWIFTDLDTFGNTTLKNLTSLRSLSDTYELNPMRIIINFINQPIYMLYLGFSVCLLIIYRHKNYLGFGIILFTLADMCALIVRVRIVDRVFVPIIILGVILLLYNFKEWYDGQRWHFKYTHFFIGVFPVLLLFYGIKDKQWFKPVPTYQESKSYQYVHNHSNQLFVFEGVSAMVESQYQINSLVIDHQLFNQNIMTLGNWDTFSKRYYSQMKKFNINEPENFIGNLDKYDNVYLMMRPETDKLELIKQWYVEHKNIEIEYEIVDNVGHLSVMKVKVKDV